MQKYLYGQKYHLRTDKSAVTWLMSFKNLEGQTARWIQRLQEYNFTSDHCQGRKHYNADVLSRWPWHKVEAQTDIKEEQVTAAAAAAGWNPAALGTQQPGHRTYSGNTANLDDFVHAVVNSSVCELAIAL
jgi:hypothetical protein